VVPATTTETKPAATPSVETTNQPKVDQLEAHFSSKPAPKEPAKVAAPVEVPPPATTDKPAEPAVPTVPTDDLDRMDLGEKASDNARTNFAKLREVAKQERLAKASLERQLADLKTQQETLAKAAPQDAAEQERIRTEHKSMADRLALVDLKNHPDYVRQFEVPKTAALAEAKEVLDYNEIPANLDSLMGKSMKEFSAEVSKLTKNLNSMDATAVQTSLRNAWKINNDATSALSKSQDLAKTLSERSAHAQKQAVEKVWDTFKGVESVLAKRAVPEGATPDELAEIASYNEGVQGLRSNYERNAFGRMTEEETARMALKATTFDFIQTHGVKMMDRAYKGMEARATAAEKQLGELKAARSPGNMGGDPQKGPATAPKTFEDVFSQRPRQ
jgi:hypothetical protein